MTSTSVSEPDLQQETTPDLEAGKSSAEDTISLTMVNDDGKLYKLSNISQDTKLSDLMKMAFEKFYKTEKKSVFKFHAICARSLQILSTFRTVQQNDLLNADEVLLVERYVSTDDMVLDQIAEDVTTSTRSRNMKATSEDPNVANRSNILARTKKLKVKNKKKKRRTLQEKSPHCNPFVVHRELDIALMNLVEFSTKLIRFNDAKEVFDDIINKAGLHMKPDKLLLSKLISMGYPGDVSEVALTLSDNNLQEASEWLATESASVTREDIEEFNALQVNFDNVEINADNFSENVMKVVAYLMKKQELYLDIFEGHLRYIIKNLEFRDEAQVRRALRKSFNDPNRAILLLLGETIDDTRSPDITAFLDKVLSDPDCLVALADKYMLLGLIDYFADPSDDGTKWHDGRQFDGQLLKLVETFESEKYFTYGCRALMIFQETNFVVMDF